VSRTFAFVDKTSNSVNGFTVVCSIKIRVHGTFRLLNECDAGGPMSTSYVGNNRPNCIIININVMDYRPVRVQ